MINWVDLDELQNLSIQCLKKNLQLNPTIHKNQLKVSGWFWAKYRVGPKIAALENSENKNKIKAV